MFEDHDLPAEIAEELFEPRPETFADDGVKALPIIVDDPPGIAQSVFPTLEKCLENVALVELGIAEQRNHTAFWSIAELSSFTEIILNERGEQCLGDAEADRSCREVDVVGVLGPRGIALRALVASEIFQLLTGLIAEQVLDCVKDRAGMSLYCDPILRAKNTEIEGRHDRRQ